MGRTSDLAAWFNANGPPVPVSKDDLPSGQPHDAAAVRISGGLGIRGGEGFSDVFTFDLRVRGHSGGVAENNGEALDAIWVNTPPGFTLGGKRVIDKGRFGGSPAYVGIDESEVYENRVIRQAPYWCEIAR